MDTLKIPPEITPDTFEDQIPEAHTNLWRRIVDKEFRALFTYVFAMLAAGSTFYHYYEGLRWIDAVYFSVSTLTTVGYGDIPIERDGTKIFTMIYIIMGLGIMLAFVNVVSKKAREEWALERALSNPILKRRTSKSRRKHNHRS